MYMFVGQRSPIGELRSSSRGRRIFSRVGGVGCVAEALDGHFEVPVDCFAEVMCQTRAGESGSSFGIAPNEVKALATALAIRPPIGMIAPSPAPLTPSGL